MIFKEIIKIYQLRNYKIVLNEFVKYSFYKSKAYYYRFIS